MTRVLLAAAAGALLLGAAAGAAPAREPAAAAFLHDVRGVSWFPARGGWTLLWTRFDAAAVDRDFARIAALRANTVRVVVAPEPFGYPEVAPAAAARLDRVVALAARHGLRVQLTLFDWWHEYDDVEGAKR